MLDVAAWTLIGKSQFLLHPNREEHLDDTPRLWCSKSQIKIRRGPNRFVNDDPSQRTLDLLRTPNPKMPAFLSKEVITCLSYGGVSNDVLKSVFLSALTQTFELLSSWDGPNDLPKLYAAIFDLEHVLMGRLRRESSGVSRAWGFGEVSKEREVDTEMDSDNEDDLSERSIAVNADVLSGLPASLAEQVLSFLSAGFTPTLTPILKSKIEVLIKGLIGLYVKKYHVALPHSVEGIAVPGELR